MRIFLNLIIIILKKQIFKSRIIFLIRVCTQVHKKSPNTRCLRYVYQLIQKHLGSIPVSHVAKKRSDGWYPINETITSLFAKRTRKNILADPVTKKHKPPNSNQRKLHATIRSLSHPFLKSPFLISSPCPHVFPNLSRRIEVSLSDLEGIIIDQFQFPQIPPLLFFDFGKFLANYQGLFVSLAHWIRIIRFSNLFFLLWSHAPSSPRIAIEGY